MWSIIANIWILGLLVFHPPWARDSRRPAAMSLALFATERCNTDVAARLNTVGLHRTHKLTTGCPPRVKARVSRARKNHPHGVGLPDAALFGRHEHRVQLARDLPQGEAVGPLFSHHSDRACSCCSSQAGDPGSQSRMTKDQSSWPRFCLVECRSRPTLSAHPSG